MLLNIVLTNLAFIATPTDSFCSANITSISANTGTRPGLTDPPEYYELVRYAPLRQTRPLTSNPEHLFNLIYDHHDPDCVQVTLERYSGRSSLSIMPDCVQTIETNGRAVALSLREVSRDRCEPSDDTACYECSNETTAMARHMKGFGRERLRLTFLRGPAAEELLMVEDVSDRVPNGLWMMLRKDRVRYRTCKCEGLRQFALKFDNVYGKLRDGNVTYVGEDLEERSISLMVWIGGLIVVPIVVVIVCLALKLLF